MKDDITKTEYSPENDKEYEENERKFGLKRALEPIFDKPIPTPEKGRCCNFLQVGDEFHCFFCHVTFPQETFYPHIEGHKSFGHETKKCTEACGKWCHSEKEKCKEHDEENCTNWHESEQEPEWEKEFVRKFAIEEYLEVKKGVFRTSGEIIRYIRSLLEKSRQEALEEQRKRIVREIDGLKKREHGNTVVPGSYGLIVETLQEKRLSNSVLNKILSLPSLTPNSETKK